MQNIFFPTRVISVWNGFPLPGYNLQFTDFVALINLLTAQDNCDRIWEKGAYRAKH